MGRRKIRIVIAGKGGVGKTTLTALLACVLSRQNIRVLAVDGDPQANLAATLGIPLSQPITPISEQKAYIQEKIGGVPGRGGFMVLNPDVADVADRFSIPAAEGIRLLVMGGVQNAGTGCLCPEYTLISTVLANTASLPEDAILLDTPAGLEHFGRAVAQGFDCALIVTDESYNARAVARDLSRLARQCGIRQVLLVVNRVSQGSENPVAIGEMAGLFQKIWVLPHDPCIVRNEPSVIPVVRDHCPIVRNIEGLSGYILAHD
ncbi:MAG: protochlorophyllide reductase iron-sulfur ATP-binding protein [Methanoregulaceae archaeon PtaB.Bin056]|jgi:CO dehydrogenase maturation factor|nr:MAG: protochlorophyllide reductase iron-sulfur ATP-binding protein [Methanoregulaceae archaeon PtaB.Bin056]